MKQVYITAAIAAAFMAIPFGMVAESPISAVMTDPVPGIYTQKEPPTTYTLDFSTPGYEITKVTDNTSYTEIPPKDEEGYASWNGLYGYCELATSPQDVLKSQPVEVKVNADKTVTLTFSTSKFNYLATVIQYEAGSLYDFNVVLPEGLFTITAVDEEGQDQEFPSPAQTFTLNHIGNWEVSEAKVNPEANTTVTSIKEFTLDFSETGESDASVQWQCTGGHNTPTIMYKPKGEKEWQPGPKLSIPTVLNNPHAQRIIVQGQALSDEGQYYLHIPFGTFQLVKESAVNGTEIQSYVNADMTFRYAIGETVNDNISKDSFFYAVYPGEGDINLIDYPSGVEFIRMVFTEIPTINRESTAPVQLFYNNATEPLRSVLPSDSEVFFVQEKGVNNIYGHEIRIYMDRGQSYIAEPGDYVIKFPEGVFQFASGETNSAFDLTWHIDKTLDYRINPEMEAKLSKFDRVTLTFPDASAVEINENNTKEPSIVSPGGGIKPEIEIKGKVVYLSFPEQTAVGLYSLNIPAGYFNVTIGNEILPNQVISKVYSIGETTIPEITPAQGILPSNTLSKVTITLPEEDYIIGFGGTISYNRLFPMGEDGEPDYGNRLAYFTVEHPDEALETNQFSLVPTNGRPVTLSAGNYIFITGTALYTLGDGTQPREFKYYWTALPDYEVLPKAAISPAEGNVNDLCFFTLTADVEINKVNNVNSYIYPVNADGTYGPAVATLMATRGNTSKEVDLIAINSINAPKGKYALVTPKGLYISGEKQADSYTYTFDLTEDLSAAVEGIGAENNGLYNVYSITGICVLRNASEEQLANLPAGFYIINGKKVIIRK